MYKTKPYLLFEIQDGKVFQNSTSTLVLTSQSMIRFLENLETDKSLLTSEERIKEYFPNNHTDALKFLLDNGIIYKEKLPHFRFDEVHVVSNSKVFNEAVLYFSQDMEFTTILHAFESKPLDMHRLRENTLCLVFLNPFNLKIHEKIATEMRTIACISKFIFYYNHSLYMSNFHKPSWVNPCPKCFFYNVEAQLRGGPRNLSKNFQSMIDMMYVKETMFDIEAVLAPHDLLGVMNVLFTQIKSSTEFNSYTNVVHSFTQDFIKVNTDYAIHWELCDCYE